MKNRIVGIGALLISLLLVSTATAVPKTYSEPAMEMIEEKEQMTSGFDSLKNGIQTTGIIDLIIQLLVTILNFIQELISIVSDLFQIITLVEMIISAVTQLINIIFQLIETISNLFTPNVHLNI